MIWQTLLSRRWILVTTMAVLAAAVCVRLGIWQLDRLAERRASNDHIRTMASRSPVQLPTTEDLTAEEYRAVDARGVFDYEHQIVVRNQIYNGEYGFHLVTPLLLDPSGSSAGTSGPAVLVDRGWIPAAGNTQPADWHKYDVTGPVSVDGVIRLGQDASVMGGPAETAAATGQAGSDFWVYLNIQRIGGQLPYPLLPVYIQLGPNQNLTALPIPYQETLDLSDGPHEGYAIQWFSFGALVLVGYPAYVRKQEKKRA